MTLDNLLSFHFIRSAVKELGRKPLVRAMIHLCCYGCNKWSRFQKDRLLANDAAQRTSSIDHWEKGARLICTGLLHCTGFLPDTGLPDQ